MIQAAHVAQLRDPAPLRLRHELVEMGSGLSAQILKLKIKEIVDLRKQTPRITELPPQIGQLQKARELFLSENDIATVPDEIGKLGQLELLDLSRNRLTGLPSTMGSLKSLKTLQLQENKLFFSGVHPCLGQLQA